MRQVTFANHAENEWILDWTQEVTEGDLAPERGGPLVSHLDAGVQSCLAFLAGQGLLFGRTTA